MRDGPPAVSQRKIRIARDRFVKEPHRLEQGFLPILRVVKGRDQFLGAQIEIEGADVPR